MAYRRGDYGDDVLGMMDALDCAVRTNADEETRAAIDAHYRHLIGDCDAEGCEWCKEWREQEDEDNKAKQTSEGRVMRKSLRQFIREHREELDQHIQRISPGAPRNDHERELWILNDEGLYLWARREGVRL